MNIHEPSDQKLLYFRKLLIEWIKDLPWWRRLFNRFQ